MVLAGVLGAVFVGAIVPAVLCAVLMRSAGSRRRLGSARVAKPSTVVAQSLERRTDGMRFSTAEAPENVLARVVVALDLPTERPKLTPALYIQCASEDSAVICFGNFVEPEQVRAELSVSPGSFPGMTKGVLEFSSAPSEVADNRALIKGYVLHLRRTISALLLAGDPYATIVDDTPASNDSPGSDVTGPRAA